MIVLKLKDHIYINLKVGIFVKHDYRERFSSK